MYVVVVVIVVVIFFVLGWRKEMKSFKNSINFPVQLSALCGPHFATEAYFGKLTHAHFSRKTHS